MQALAVQALTSLQLPSMGNNQRKSSAAAKAWEELLPVFRSLYTKQGLNQRTAAAAAGVHQTVIGKFLSGKSIPNFRTMDKRARQLGVKGGILELIRNPKNDPQLPELMRAWEAQPDQASRNLVIDMVWSIARGRQGAAGTLSRLTPRQVEVLTAFERLAALPGGVELQAAWLRMGDVQRLSAAAGLPPVVPPAPALPTRRRRR